MILHLNFLRLELVKTVNLSNHNPYEVSIKGQTKYTTNTSVAFPLSLLLLLLPLLQRNGQVKPFGTLNEHMSRENFALQKSKRRS